MPNLKLTDLKWGTLNNIRENDSNASGDRRRTSTNTAIRFATEKAFEKDTLAGISEFNGIVVHARITTFSSYQNRSSLLKQFILPSTASAETQDYISYAYKVYIPEMECRPVPSSYDDPVLITYPDIHSDLETSAPIPPGTLVVVKYEDPGNLFNPRIVRVTGEPVAITGITVDEAGKKIFENGKPRVLGGSKGPMLPRSSEPAGDYHYPPSSKKLKTLLRKALTEASLPSEWADWEETHYIINSESGGKVGVPNYTYASLYSNIQSHPEKWHEVWQLIKEGKSGTSSGWVNRSSASGLGQLQRDNVLVFYPDKLEGLGDPLNEAVGFFKYIRDRYGDPKTARSVYNVGGKGSEAVSYVHSVTKKPKRKTFKEGY